MTYEVTKMDHLGRGIIYYENKITFVPKTIIKDVIEVELVEVHKKYNLGKVTKYVSRPNKSNIITCPYYDTCGGCDLLDLSYSDTIKYKENKVKELFYKYLNLEIEPIIIQSNSKTNYRNKIELIVDNGIIGFNEKKSHEVLSVDNCLMANKKLNETISFLKTLNLNNAKVTLRVNYLEEILVIIGTEEKIVLNEVPTFIKGIIVNDQTLYGENYFYEMINDLMFKVSYDAFFQINSGINEELFKIINENISENSQVLDLYCGVGTLGINASKKAKLVHGIEIIPNAIADANINRELNQAQNITFCCGDVLKLISGVKNKFDTIILDPPRKGIDTNTINYLLKEDINKIIYVSCDLTSFLSNYLSLDTKYQIEKVYLLDMFPYTHHVECVTLLCRKTL